MSKTGLKKSHAKTSSTRKSKKRDGIYQARAIKLLSIIGVVVTIAIFIYAQVFTAFEEEKILNSQKDSVFKNSIPLLAVNEIDEEIVSSSMIPLNLELTRGEGNIYINLNSYTELDTQISITNSQNTICSLLELPCSEFDFYYTFDDASLVLKGPSASSSIGVLVYSTLQQIELDDSFAMTGNLNSNGIIGMVGGIDEKVKRARDEGFQRVYIPLDSLNYTQTLNSSNEEEGFEIIESLDILDVLKEEFNSSDIVLPEETYSLASYTKTMKEISDELCYLSQNYLEQIRNDENISINSSRVQTSISQINNSEIANENREFYSRGSFCYSANIGLKNEINLKTITSLPKLEGEIHQLEEELEAKKRMYEPKLFPQTLNSLNDIYTYLLLSNRIYETEEFIDTSKEYFNLSQGIENQSQENLTINSSQTEAFRQNTTISSKEDFSIAVEQLSLAQERFTTVEQWESVFGSSNAKKAQLSYNRAQEICRLYITENTVLNNLMNQYGISVFDESVEGLDELRLENPYLCIFNGMQVKGRINSVLIGNSADSGDIDNLIREFQKIAQSRMEFKSQGEVPLIPYISYEYSQSLSNVGNTQSALQYVQLALAYSELNILLDETPETSSSDFFSSKLTPIQEEQLESLSLIKNSSYLFLLLSLGFMLYILKE